MRLLLLILLAALPEIARSDTGIGSAYPGDLGIEADPRVLFQPEVAASTPRYEVLGALSAGESSIVHLARRVAPRAEAGADLVALKRPHGAAATRPHALQAFAREARFGALVRGPNLVSALDRGADEHGPYFTMDYVRGPSLARLQCVDADGATIIARLSTSVESTWPSPRRPSSRPQ